MKEQLVSIIMNCYNSEKYLNDSIVSVINQNYTNWELIFWDNLSTDKSSQIISKYKDKRIRYYLSKKHTSLGQARNNAIKKAKGEFIAFLDCDDIWLSEKLKHQIPLFCDPEVGIVICNSIFFNSKNNEKLLYTNKKPKEGYVFKELLESYNISLETAIIRKSAIEKLDHYFDNRFEVIEEFDLFIRLAKEFKLAYVDKALAKWRVHENSLTWTKKELFPSEMRLFAKKIARFIPQFNSEYKDILNKINENIIYQEFLINWENKNKENYRKELRFIIMKSKKYLVVYLLSLILPFKIFDFLNKKRLLLN